MKPIEEWTGKIHCGNALELLAEMPDDSVDLILTSPGYFGLRAYGKETEIDWPDGWHGQQGLEPTPEMYVDHLMLFMREMKRVLKPTGSLYLNIGDTYSSSLGPHGNETAGFSKDAMVGDEKRPPVPQAPRMGRLLIPSRVALRMQAEGWMCMDEIIWRKGNSMPSSVKSRLANSWEPIFRFVKNSKTLLWRVMRDHADHKAGAWLDRKPSTPYREYLLQRDWKDRKAGEWTAKKPPKFDGERRVWESSRTNWLGFSFYYELDAIREAHKTSTHARGPGGSMVAPRLSNKMPTQQETREASLAYGLASKLPSNYIPDPRGVPPDDVVPSTRFNIRVRDAKEGRLEGKWGGRVGATPEEVAAYDEKRYSGKFLADPEAVNSPRARTARRGYDAEGKFYAEGGKNPGDTVQLNLTQDKKWSEVQVKEKIGDAHSGWASTHLYMPHVTHHKLGKNPSDVTEETPKGSLEGKNPADVMEHREKEDDRRRLDHLSLPPEPEVDPERAFSEAGKNPGDTVYVSTRPSAGSDPRSENADRLSQARGHGGWRGNNMVRADGKNPGDTETVPPETRTMGAITGEKGAVKVPGGKGWTGHWPGGGARIYGENDPRWLSPEGKNPGDFQTINTQPNKEAHFASFPLGICWNPILSSCPPGGIVLDPFCGSGTVAEAVELANILGKDAKDRDRVAEVRAEFAKGQKPLVRKAHRRWIMIEISPNYVQIAKRRLKPYGPMEIVHHV